MNMTREMAGFLFMVIASGILVVIGPLDFFMSFLAGLGFNQLGLIEYDLKSEPHTLGNVFGWVAGITMSGLLILATFLGMLSLAFYAFFDGNFIEELRRL